MVIWLFLVSCCSVSICLGVVVVVSSGDEVVKIYCMLSNVVCKVGMSLVSMCGFWCSFVLLIVIIFCVV